MGKLERLTKDNLAQRMEYFDSICIKLRDRRTPDFSFISDEFVETLASPGGDVDLYVILMSAGYSLVDLDGINVGSNDSILKAMRNETDIKKLRIYCVLFLSAWFPQLKSLNPSVLGKLYELY